MRLLSFRGVFLDPVKAFCDHSPSLHQAITRPGAGAVSRIPSSISSIKSLSEAKPWLLATLLGEVSNRCKDKQTAGLSAHSGGEALTKSVFL